MRKFAGPAGTVSRHVIESDALRTTCWATRRRASSTSTCRPAMTGAACRCWSISSASPAAAGPHQLGRLPREPAGAARPPDRRADAAGRRRLPRLLHPARRQPVHQLGRHRALGGLPDPRDAAGGRAALRLRRRWPPRRVRQELRRLRRDHARAAPFRHLGGGGLPLRRHGVRALLPARHAGGPARARRRRQLDRAVVAAARRRKKHRTAPSR